MAESPETSVVFIESLNAVRLAKLTTDSGRGRLKMQDLNLEDQKIMNERKM